MGSPAMSGDWGVDIENHFRQFLRISVTKIVTEIEKVTSL